MRWLVLVIGFLLAPAARADALLQEAIGLGGPAMWLESGAPGMVLAVVRGEDSIVAGYGETAKGSGREPDARSLLRLGSISKVFTTEVLASMVNDGTVRLADTLQRYAGDVRVPVADGREMTLLELATHTAGLPRETGINSDKAQFTWPTRDNRWTWLEKQTLGWAPGSVAAYSNIGFDLLADALEAAGKRPYPELLAMRLTQKLGMADTGVSPNPEQCGRLMIGTGLAPATPCLDTRATAGSGGVYSTGADMALWLRHQLRQRDPDLLLSYAVYYPRQVLAAAIGFDEGGPMTGIGLGWVVMAAHGQFPLIVQKAGGGAGFMTYAAFAPGTGVGVFVAVTRVDFGMFGALSQAANGLIASLVTR
jgi:D-alanyl-D-alanine-carboxypeptidase/D-alanyl-D-alanine-endopeptidase